MFGRFFGLQVSPRLGSTNKIALCNSASNLSTPLLSKYYVHPTIQGMVNTTAENQDEHGSVAPVLYLLGHSYTDKKGLIAHIESLLQADDVLCDDFLGDTLVLSDMRSADWHRSLIGEKLEVHTSNTKKTWTIKYILRLCEAQGAMQLPDGPYLLVGKSLHQAWRYYADDLDSFITTIVPNSDSNISDGFQTLDAASPDGLWRAVAVPSRLYAVQSIDKPLAGKRFSVKDNYKLRGIKTTQMNRAFVELYPKESETAAFVKRLLSLGAIVVAKTKMCAFASSEEATDQWIDFHAPFNPRADRYQSPSGSTTGGATSAAGYDWIDFAIGTDTTGSTRWPAAWNGLYGLRTSHDSNDLTGVYHSCRQFDSVGMLTRSLTGLSELAEASIEHHSGNLKKYPPTLLYPTDFFPHTNKVQQATLEKFITVLENFLGLRCEQFSIAERWESSPPPEANGKSIQDYLNTTAFYPFFYDGYHGFDKFRNDYRSKFGKDVYVGPYMQWKWEQGKQVTQEHVTKAMEELAVYRRWFSENVVGVDEKTGSNAILILPVGTSAPKYRDERNSEPGSVPAFSPNYIGSMNKLAQLVLPIGQFPFHSRVSGREEFLPIVASIAGAQGSDLMLLNLAKEALEMAGWPTEVQTGRLAFPDCSGCCGDLPSPKRVDSGYTVDNHLSSGQSNL